MPPSETLLHVKGSRDAAFHALRALAVALSFLTLSFASSAGAQPASPSSVESEAPPPRLRAREISQETIVSREGLPYLIYLSVPRGPPPEGGFPVFYVLDGDAFFNTAVEVTRMREWGRLTPSIVVGVGYPNANFYDGARRTYDFTPPGWREADVDPSEVGGADQFLAFLDGVLKPWVRERLSIDERREFLYGHSLGGHFVMHALFVSPQSFDVYLAASPTLGISDEAILREASAFEHRPDRDATRALFTVGSMESSPPVEQVDDYRRYFAAHPEVRPGLSVEQALAQTFPINRGFNKARETRRLARRLSRSGARVSFLEFEGDEHMPAAITALSRGVPFALRPARR